MTREKAIEILMNERGHDYNGADNICDYLEEDGRLETMTRHELIIESMNQYEDEDATNKYDFIDTLDDWTNATDDPDTLGKIINIADKLGFYGVGDRALDKLDAIKNGRSNF